MGRNFIKQRTDAVNTYGVEHGAYIGFGGGVAAWTLTDHREFWAAKRGSVGRANPGAALRVVSDDEARWRTANLRPQKQPGYAIVIATEDRRYRIRNLENGEVAIYTDQGDKIVLKRGGTIAVTASTKVEITSPSVTMSGNLTVDGTITGTTDVVGGGKSLKNHTHSVSGTVSSAPGSVTFVPPGTTGSPT